jgi:hypothetical protein
LCGFDRPFARNRDKHVQFPNRLV